MSTRRAYRGHARRFVEFLASWPGEGGDPLTDAHARDYAVRDFKSHLKTVRRAKPASVNLALAAIDHFYRYLGAGRPDVRREELAQAAPRALSAEQLQRFMRAVERCESPRDRAIAVLLVNTGLRIGECAALDVDGLGTVARVREDGFGRIITIAAPPELLRYVVHKGSIAVDGVSLTVARIDDGGFDVSLIPQTLERTNLGAAGAGRGVNLEVDVLAKHGEKLLAR